MASDSWLKPEDRAYTVPMTQHTWIISAALGLALTLSGCSSSAMYDEASSSYAPDMGMTDVAPMAEESLDPGAAAVDRSQIITGDLYLTVESITETADSIQEIVEKAGGRVDSRSEYTEGDGTSPSAYLWVRIPATALTPTLDEIKALGEVERVSLSSTDVTLQVVDLDARIAVLEKGIERLTALLEKATTTSDLIELETAITQRQSELDSLNGQRTYLADQIALASISIELRTPEEAPVREPGSFWDGIVTGWNALVSFFQGALVVAGVLVPWLAVAVVVAIVVIVIVRAIRRRRHTPTRSDAPKSEQK